MKQKKKSLILLVFLFMLPLAAKLSGGSMKEVHGAAQERYYYSQLTEEAKKFYDAMYQMYEQGIFKTGTGDYDLAASQSVTAEQLESYASGNNSLLLAMGAARDAFCADYPDIFYVDFSCLSLRVTRDGGGNYHAWLGSGRSSDYYVKGFENSQQVEEAIAAYESRIGEIVAGAQSLSVAEGENLTEQQVKYAHNEIINHTTYRLENTCKKENAGHIRTAYGALIKGESLCEGYARAMKSVLDRLGIPCVLIQGMYQLARDQGELHMWNYVQVDGRWYGVDATMDDPITPVPNENGDGLDGGERTMYLLAGADVMGRRHVPNGIMSEADFEFTYPALEGQGPLFEEVVNENGLKVSYSEGMHDGLSAGIFKVSYQGMGAAKSMETGNYILMKETKYYEESKRWEYGKWAYCLPDVYPSMDDTETELTMYVPSAQFVEFAVTRENPGNYDGNNGGSLENLAFHGDPLLFEAASEQLSNPDGTYTPPPYVRKAEPVMTANLDIGRTHHLKITYDDTLKLADGAAEAGITLSVKEADTSAMQYCKVENFTWDGDRTVELDFTPSNMWLDNFITYHFGLTGLVGTDSGKVPNPFSYSSSYRSCICAYRSRGYFYNLWGRPSLLEQADLSARNWESWETEDGTGLTPEMVTGLTLVATTTTQAQADAMNSLAESTFPGEQVLKSETYNINFLTCKKNIVKLGDSVRVSVGFPAGYGPSDEGVTFKACHFIKNKAGKIIGVEEIPCTVTRYGLIITCKSFSPFAVMAVKAESPGGTPAKSVIVSNTPGGSITGAAEGIITLQPGESRTFTIQAADGYVIDQLVAGSVWQEITDEKSMTVEINYNSLESGDVVDAAFAAESVRAREARRGEAPVQPRPVPAEIRFSSRQIAIGEGQGFELAPEITEGEGIHTYQWYKNGEPLTGKTGRKLTVSSASKKDSGNYTLVVFSASGAAKVTSADEGCNVTVQVPKQPGAQPGMSAQPDTLKKVTGVSVSSDATSRTKLKWNTVSNAQGYEIFRYNPSKGRFVRINTVTGNSYTDRKKTAGKMYRYKVRAYGKSEGRTYYGPYSSEARGIVKPKSPGKVTVKRLSSKSVELSFRPVKNANTYQISQYNKSSRKYKLAYRVKSKKLYKYNARTKKWKYLKRVKTKGGKLVCSITGLKTSDKNLRFRVRTECAGYKCKTMYSAWSRTVTVK